MITYGDILFRIFKTIKPMRIIIDYIRERFKINKSPE